MDRWATYNSTDHHYHHRRRDHRHPSFSSTLLDQIYRSIDDSSDVSTRKKQNRAGVENIIVNRRAVAGDSVRSRHVEPAFFNHSSSSSSDSSGFSSSESDSFYRRRTRSPPPKPIRTTVVKSKALSDLKKAKQPISPGRRVAAFINSLFKPNKIKTVATSSTTCSSSASSFSRSCLSKTTSSESKRSVRFCPVNVILDDDKRNNRNERESIFRRQRSLEEENRRVIEAAKELLRTFQKNKDVVNISGEEDDDDDDGWSCASSDLFELDNLSTIGIDRYREELPVYETTRLNTNRIIST